MYRLTNLKIGARLALGFSLVLICASMLLAISLWRMGQLQDDAERIVFGKVAAMTTAMEMREIGVGLVVSLQKIATPTDATEGEREAKRLDALLQDYAKSEKLLQDLVFTPEAKNALAAAAAQENQVFPVIHKLRSEVAEGNYFEAAARLKNDFLPRQERWISSLLALVENQQREMKATHGESRASYKATRLGILSVGIFMIALAAVIAVFITQTITRPLRHAAQVANMIASGDLTAQIEGASADEVGQLVGYIKTMQEQLVSSIHRIKHSTDTISVAVREIALGNADLSSRTEAQAASLEETVTSLERLTQTVKENASNAENANSLVTAASERAFKGGQVVQQVVETMGSIQGRSRKIVDIISVIDGIAFQTNILALNAAVEAARAGEQGRGFAVVAAEVRGLAQRSASAAKEIKDLITDSVRTIDIGGALVGEAGATMKEIVSSVTHVANIMAEMTKASHEQSTGIEEINCAVAQMDERTQQNAALVEEASAAAGSLEDQVVALVDAVATFKLARH